MSEAGQLPRVRVEGGPRERGRACGSAAAERIDLSIQGYREVFADYTGWDWNRVREEAARYEAPIEAYSEKYMEELRGLSEGAGIDLLDVLAINVRTEVMFAAKARLAGDVKPMPPECSSFAVLPEASANGNTLIGQNWDWLLHCFETVIVVEAAQEDGPDFVTVVEAGLLAKTGMNAAGIGLAPNALVTEADRGEPGVPFHVLLRAVLDAETITEAFSALQRAGRSSSANYTIAHRDGLAAAIEAAPGDHSRLFPVFPGDGVLLHTNHFLTDRLPVADLSVWAMPDSPFRLDRLRRAVADSRTDLGLEALAGFLSDHAGYPDSVCCHPDRRKPGTEQFATVASVLMDLDEQQMLVADGPPCSTPYEEVDCRRFFGEPSTREDEAIR